MLPPSGGRDARSGKLPDPPPFGRYPLTLQASGEDPLRRPFRPLPVMPGRVRIVADIAGQQFLQRGAALPRGDHRARQDHRTLAGEAFRDTW